MYEQVRVEAIGDDALPDCVPVIGESFATVAEEFGLTEANCPTNPAFIREERLAGCVAVEAKGDVAYIEKLAVLPAYRHRGLGKRLVDAAMEYAGVMGCGTVSIGIIDENRVLKEWYRGMGFEVTEIKRFDHLPFRVCMMERKI